MRKQNNLVNNINNSFNNINNKTKIMIDNELYINIFRVVLIIYSAVVLPLLDNKHILMIDNIFKQNIFKLIMVSFIIYLSFMDMVTALLVTIAFFITIIHLKNKKKNMSDINQNNNIQNIMELVNNKENFNLSKNENNNKENLFQHKNLSEILNFPEYNLNKTDQNILISSQKEENNYMIKLDDIFKNPEFAKLFTIKEDVDFDINNFNYHILDIKLNDNSLFIDDINTGIEIQNNIITEDNLIKMFTYNSQYLKDVAIDKKKLLFMNLEFINLFLTNIINFCYYSLLNEEEQDKLMKIFEKLYQTLNTTEFDKYNYINSIYISHINYKILLQIENKKEFNGRTIKNLFKETVFQRIFESIQNIKQNDISFYIEEDIIDLVPGEITNQKKNTEEDIIDLVQGEITNQKKNTEQNTEQNIKYLKMNDVCNDEKLKPKPRHCDPFTNMDDDTKKNNMPGPYDDENNLKNINNIPVPYDIDDNLNNISPGVSDDLLENKIIIQDNNNIKTENDLNIHEDNLTNINDLHPASKTLTDNILRAKNSETNKNDPNSFTTGQNLYDISENAVPNTDILHEVKSVEKQLSAQGMDFPMGYGAKRYDGYHFKANETHKKLEHSMLRNERLNE